MRIASLAVTLALVACGSDPSPAADAPIADAPAADAPVADAAACTPSTARFGDLGARPGTARYSPASTPVPMPMVGQVEVMLELEDAAVPDRLFVWLWPSGPPFLVDGNLGPIHTGSFPIAGPQLQLGTCGVCVMVSADDGDPYLATGGTVDVTALDAAHGGSITMSVTDLTFEHIRITDTGGSVPVGDGCTTAIDRVTFTGPFP